MLDRVQFHFCPVEEDSFLLTPALIITRGRDAASHTPMRAFMLQAQWLMFGLGVTFDFS